MKIERTHRGFATAEFVDLNGEKCSIQKSSVATEDCIWLGVSDPSVQVFIPGKSWQPVPLPQDTLIASRMHLTQDMVKELLPILQRFAETGEID